ncbi:MAG: hypothetical protein WCR59_11100, partial [Planctomycetota bacterium]
MQNATVLLIISVIAPAQQSQQTLSTALRALDSATQDLLRNGRVAAARQLLAVLTELGYDGKTLQKLRTSLENQKPGKPKDSADKAAAALRKAVLPLIAELPKLPIQQRQKVAAAILRIDGECEAAHAALLQQREGAKWLDAQAAQCAARVPVIERAITDARRLPFIIEAKSTHHPLYQALGIDPVTEVRLGDLTVYTEWPIAKAARAVRTAAQGCALSRWLMDQPLAFVPGKRTYLHFAQQTFYQKAITWLQGQKRIDDAETIAVRNLLAFDIGNERLLQDLTE